MKQNEEQICVCGHYKKEHILICQNPMIGKGVGGICSCSRFIPKVLPAPLKAKEINLDRNYWNTQCNICLQWFTTWGIHIHKARKHLLKPKRQEEWEIKPEEWGRFIENRPYFRKMPQKNWEALKDFIRNLLAKERKEYEKG